MVDDDVACLAGGVGADHALARHDLADERVLGLGHVHRDAGLVPIRLGLEEVEVTRAREGRAGHAIDLGAVERHRGDRGHGQGLHAGATETCTRGKGKALEGKCCL